MSIKRPPRPAPVVVWNGTAQAFVYDTAGRVIAAQSKRDADANDPETARRIARRDLHVLQETK